MLVGKEVVAGIHNKRACSCLRFALFGGLAACIYVRRPCFVSHSYCPYRDVDEWMRLVHVDSKYRTQHGWRSGGHCKIPFAELEHGLRRIRFNGSLSLFGDWCTRFHATQSTGEVKCVISLRD